MGRYEYARRWLDRAAIATAGGRLILGTCAIARPELPLRPWVGAAAADTVPVRLLARALGGRDIALGVGAIAARSRADLRLWLVTAAIADLTDAAATMGSWSALPKHGRLAVALAAGGAAVIGIAAGTTAPDKA